MFPWLSQYLTLGTYPSYKFQLPDVNKYKVETVPELVYAREVLAKRGLKDPWLRYATAIVNLAYKVQKTDIKSYKQRNGDAKCKLSLTLFPKFVHFAGTNVGDTLRTVTKLSVNKSCIILSRVDLGTAYF